MGLEELRAGTLVAFLEVEVGLGFEVPEALGKEALFYPVSVVEPLAGFVKNEVFVTG